MCIRDRDSSNSRRRASPTTREAERATSPRLTRLTRLTRLQRERWRLPSSPWRPLHEKTRVPRGYPPETRGLLAGRDAFTTSFRSHSNSSRFAQVSRQSQAFAHGFGYIVVSDIETPDPPRHRALSRREAHGGRAPQAAVGAERGERDLEPASGASRPRPSLSTRDGPRNAINTSERRARGRVLTRHPPPLVANRRMCSIGCVD